MIILVSGCQETEQKQETASPKTEKERLSYAIGVNMGQSIAEIKDDIDLSMLQKGMTDQVRGNEMLVSTEEGQSLRRAFSEKLMTREQEKIIAEVKKNEEEGQAFLEENRTKEGVVTTESGLQYKVMKEGTGKTPKATDSVKVHYEGATLDGNVFDSSYKRRKPETFVVGDVIRGWTEGLQLMKEGGKYKLFIPPGLAYGPNGAGRDIGPNETLIFDVELLEVVDEQQGEEQ